MSRMARLDIVFSSEILPAKRKKANIWCDPNNAIIFLWLPQFTRNGADDHLAFSTWLLRASFQLSRQLVHFTIAKSSIPDKKDKLWLWYTFCVFASCYFTYSIAHRRLANAFEMESKQNILFKKLKTRNENGEVRRCLMILFRCTLKLCWIPFRSKRIMCTVKCGAAFVFRDEFESFPQAILKVFRYIKQFFDFS